MDLLTNNGWTHSGKACKCQGGGDIYKKGKYTLTVLKTKFKLRGWKYYRKIDELESTLSSLQDG